MDSTPIPKLVTTRRFPCQLIAPIRRLFFFASEFLSGQTCCEYQSALLSAVHSLVTQWPTNAMMAITATSKIPSNTVYSMSAVPSSSFSKILEN